MPPTPSETTPWGGVGDTVAIYEAGSIGPASVHFAKIDKVTATQVVVGTRRFRREDGRERGATYHGARLRRPEERDVQDVVAAWAVRMMGIPLGKAVQNVRSRDGALRALQEISRLVRETADKLGVNHADLV